jgi:N-methylhydantoinase A/acetone carboxylase, beta subunit
MWRVGVDIGGAFTDAYALNEETGEFRWVKVETTPDIVSGVVEALKKLGIDMGSVRLGIL